MEINHKKSYIDKSVMITQELPANLKNFITQLEEADKNNPIRYFDIYDDLDINAKNAYACGYITKDTWNQIERKYYIYALAVEREEALSTVIYNLNDCPISERNSSYGGNSGDKEGIIIDGEPWLVKYPKDASYLHNTGELKEILTPLSEYIGSHIYQILGYDTHETILGVRDGKIVVACKDFRNEHSELLEFRVLKNTHNKELSEQLKLSHSMHSTGSAHVVNLMDFKLHLAHNPALQGINGLNERVWNCVIIDGLINNNDRNDGNWGVIRENKRDRLAPVYDNGAAFSPKVSDERLKNKLSNASDMCNGVTIYSIDGENNLRFADLLKLDDPDIQAAIRRVVPRIKAKLPDMIEFINRIPYECQGYEVISEIRKNEYMAELKTRTETLLIPAYEHVKNMTNQMNIESVEKSKMSIKERLEFNKARMKGEYFNEKSSNRNLDISR